MYKIKTPNENYNGTTFGVQFKNGMAEVESEELKNILVYNFGYQLIEENKQEDVKPKRSRKK